MRVTVLLFAGARDHAGASTLDLDLPDPATVAALRAAVAAACPALAPILPSTRFAVGREYVEEDHVIPAGAEVAAIPPVSGGAGPDEPTIIAIQATPIDHVAVVESIRRNHAGGVCSFLGTVRDLTAGQETVRLDYEAYPEMAERELARLAAEARGRWPIVGLALVHRVGTLDPGDVAVVVAVSCPHRDAAFDACRWLIDTVKATVPIWKREIWTDGAEAWIHPGA